MPKCVGGITWSKHAHIQSSFGRLKPICDICIIRFNYIYSRAALAWTKYNTKHSLRNEKLKAYICMYVCMYAYKYSVDIYLLFMIKFRVR